VTSPAASKAIPRAVIIGQAVGAGTSIISPDEFLLSSDDMSSSVMLRNPAREMSGSSAKPAVHIVTVLFIGSLNLIV
jgi:hypothetical protein